MAETTSDAALHLRVLRAGSVAIDRWWDYREITGGFWRCYRNRDAGATVTVGGRRMALAAGRVVLIPPWLRFTCSCSGAVRSLFLHLDASGLPTALVRELVPRPLTLPPDALLDQLCDRLASLLERSDADALVVACQARALGFQLFADLAASLPPSAAARWLAHLQGRSPVATALAWIEDYLAEPIANARLAHLCGLSEGRFIRIFSSLIGQTPARYVQERRLVRASTHLVHGSDDIAAIAAGCGFANRYHFSRVFARRFGCGPAAYRQRGRHRA